MLELSDAFPKYGVIFKATICVLVAPASVPYSFCARQRRQDPTLLQGQAPVPAPGTDRGVPLPSGPRTFPRSRDRIYANENLDVMPADSLTCGTRISRVRRSSDISVLKSSSELPSQNWRGFSNHPSMASPRTGDKERTLRPDLEGRPSPLQATPSCFCDGYRLETTSSFRESFRERL